MLRMNARVSRSVNSRRARNACMARAYCADDQLRDSSGIACDLTAPYRLSKPFGERAAKMSRRHFSEIVANLVSAPRSIEGESGRHFLGGVDRNLPENIAELRVERRRGMKTFLQGLQDRRIRWPQRSAYQPLLSAHSDEQCGRRDGEFLGDGVHRLLNPLLEKYLARGFDDLSVTHFPTSSHYIST